MQAAGLPIRGKTEFSVLLKDTLIDGRDERRIKGLIFRRTHFGT